MMEKLSSKLEKGLKYLIASILLAIPLYPKFPLINIPQTYVSVRLEDFVMVIALILLVILIVNNIKPFLSEKINQAILLFLVVGLISLASAHFVTQTITPHIGILHWARRVEYFVPFFLGVIAARRKEDLEFYLKVIMVTILTSFLYGFGQRYLEFPIIVTQNLEYSKGIALRYIPGSHINSGFAGHYDLGTYLVFLLPILISLFFLINNIKTKILLLFTTSGGLWLLSFSGSRISAFSYLVSSTLALIFIKKYKAIPVVLIFSLIFFSMSPNLTSRYLRIIQVTGKKLIGSLIFEKVSPDYIFAQDKTVGVPVKREVPLPTPTPQPIFEDRSTSIRLNVEWPRAIRSFYKNPLLGTGYSSNTLATDNDYLRLFGEVGLLGFFAFTLILLRIVNAILKKFPLTQSYKGINLAFIGGVSGGFVGILISAILLDVFEASKFAMIFWLIIGITVGFAKNKIYE